MSDLIVTCVYCGHEYPNGTPTSQHKRLTKHIMTCEKHPMKKVLDALILVAGSKDVTELKIMRDFLETASKHDSSAFAAYNATKVLVEVLEEENNNV